MSVENVLLQMADKLSAVEQEIRNACKDHVAFREYRDWDSALDIADILGIYARAMMGMIEAERHVHPQSKRVGDPGSQHSDVTEGYAVSPVSDSHIVAPHTSEMLHVGGGIRVENLGDIPVVVTAQPILHEGGSPG